MTRRRKKHRPDEIVVKLRDADPRSSTPLDAIRRLMQRLVLATSSLRPRRLGAAVGAGRLFCRQQHLAAALL